MKSSKKQIKDERAIIRNMFDNYLAHKGIKMTKQISSGSNGFFGGTGPTYDNRIVYKSQDIRQLVKEGFNMDENTGHWTFNMIYTQI